MLNFFTRPPAKAQTSSDRYADFQQTLYDAAFNALGRLNQHKLPPFIRNGGKVNYINLWSKMHLNQFKTKYLIHGHATVAQQSVPL
jgi:hypothetical protein